MNKEIRSVAPTDAEVRATRRGRIINGRAIVFGKESKDLGGFVEVIEREAVDGVLEKSDILALLNHDENRGVLARSTNGNGTLSLTVDANGVNYEFEAPETALGDEVLSGIRRNDIRTSSFAFSIEEGGDKWEKRSDGTYLRTIKKFKNIYDVSPVYREAYQDTTAAVRSLVEVKTSEETAEATKKIADLEEQLRQALSPCESTNASEVEEVREEVVKEPEVTPVVEDKKPSYAELEAYYKGLEEKMSNVIKSK